MRKFICTLSICFLMLFSAIQGQNQNQDKNAQAQHAELGMAAWNNTSGGRSNPHPDAQWFSEAGFGLFIHWGMAAVHGGIDLSWGMLANKGWPDDGTITPNEYFGLMKKWKADGFNMDKTIKAAAAAGFKYAVLVTKHHDGFTLWPSEYGEIGTKKKFNGRDFVKEFVDACRKYKLRVGLYYSPPDWYFDREYRNWSLSKTHYLDMDHKPTTPKQKPADHNKALTEMIKNQVRELLTNYGKIDMMWFDGGNGQMPNDTIRKLQPGIVINKRNGGNGDYSDSEGRLPAKRFEGWFEANDPCWPTRWWSYSACDKNDDAGTVLSNLIRMRAWGGNYLANVAPLASGKIPSEVYSIWKEMSKWMQHSSESVFEVHAGPYPEKASVPVTVGKNVAYCFALPGFQGYLTLKEIKAPKRVTLLRTKEQLSFEYAHGIMTLQIPPRMRSRLPDAVKVEW